MSLETAVLPQPRGLHSGHPPRHLSIESPPRGRPAERACGWAGGCDGRQRHGTAAGRAALGNRSDAGFTLKVFRIVTAGALVMFIFVAVRGLLMEGFFPTVDQAAAAVMAAILVLSGRKPGWIRSLSWISMLVFVVSILDGLWDFRADSPLSPTAILLPLLVLYGAVLGDIAMSMVSLLFVLGIYAASWARNAPLEKYEIFALTNLALLSVLSSLVSLAVWLRYRRQNQELDRKSGELEAELERAQRLSAVIFHDIRNPLTALSGLLELARSRGLRQSDIDSLSRMTARIGEIIDSAGEIEAGFGASIEMHPVPVSAIFSDLSEIFRTRLASKNLELVLSDPGGEVVNTNVPLLRNSVLSNLLSNAVKFSPAGSPIELRASREGDSVRMEVRDRGSGFPAAMLAQRGQASCVVSKGTSGETGSGHGLRIASFYAGLLRGRLEIRNSEDGGASASIILPAGRG